MANNRIRMKQLHTLITYLVSGRSKRWIARSLGISPKTVDTYLGYLHSEIGSDLSELLIWDEEALFRLVKRLDSPTTHQELELLFPLYQKEFQKVSIAFT
ncbi:hypothetical protein GVN20_05490 [Runella sp. CRIBMP]|uniref:hypothetical protein n=1 Tax=Runella sp. CRIBMP TaxID=2683261 RepID=UPI001411B632|nr:hypothetical protein [Runella sp. CRIBMP]NBB18805.1 hypothetical protein [Runella sp. CRIBMP]